MVNKEKYFSSFEGGIAVSSFKRKNILFTKHTAGQVLIFIAVHKVLSIFLMEGELAKLIKHVLLC